MPISRSALGALCAFLMAAGASQAADPDMARWAPVVARAVEPLMQRYGVPGMAVGIVADGHGAVFDFGVASRATGRLVDGETLFEIGSVSKTFTATLAAYAEVTGHLSLRDTAGTRWPALQGSALGDVTLLNLGTHTPGGMPLQFPDDVTTDAAVIRYFRAWTPTFPPGSTRTYANPSVGLLGLIVARSLQAPFDDAMARLVFQPLGLQHSYLAVPSSAMDHYAQGYTSKDIPTRMSPGPLASEAYGVRTTAADMVRFVEANMGLLDLPGDLVRAIGRTHTGYFAVGAMTQDLIWEQYRAPVSLNDLQAGNAADVGLKPNPAARIEPPLPPRGDVLIDKTGSTNGFGAYVAFEPGTRTGIVLLANKNDPIEARVEAAYAILTRIASGEAGEP